MVPRYFVWLMKLNTSLLNPLFCISVFTCFTFAGVALSSPKGVKALDGLFNGYNLSDAWRQAVSIGQCALLGIQMHVIIFLPCGGSLFYPGAFTFFL